MDYQKILKGIHQEIEPYATIGKQADYIPALAKLITFRHSPKSIRTSSECAFTPYKAKPSCMEKLLPASPYKVFRKYFPLPCA